MSLPRYPNLRDSGVRWLGRIPAHWGVDRLKASITSCKNGIWGEEPSGEGDDIDCVRVADFDRVRLVVDGAVPTRRRVTAAERAGRILKRGDLLLEKSGGGEKQPVGQVVLYDRDELAICSNFVAKVALADGMIPRFWMYQHAAAYSCGVNVGAIKQTSGIQNLDQSQYFDERGVFPPRDEQIAIASFLDRETAKIDALIAEQEKLLALLAEKRQATISHAVNHGLGTNVQMRPSGSRWIGHMPAHWTLVPLKEITDATRPIMYGIVLPGPDVGGGGVPILKGGNVRPSRMKLGEMARTTPEIEAPYARARLRAGDLVYSIRGSIGDCEIVPEELAGANITQDVARVAVGEKHCAEWVRWALLSAPIREELASGSLGAAIRGVNIFDLKRVRLPTPPRGEQEAIAAYLNECSVSFDRLATNCKRAIELLQERRSALITAAVTGQVDVRSAAVVEDAA